MSLAAQAPDDVAWTAICRVSDIDREEGVAALIDGQQVAVFRTYDDVLYALANRDPWTGANVLSRGIVGTRGERPTVASPLLKQVFDLRTGVCLDDPGVSVPAYPVRVRGEFVEVAVR